MKGQAEVATYIAEICGDLRGLASTAGLTFLAYLLDLAKLEALQGSSMPEGARARRAPRRVVG